MIRSYMVIAIRTLVRHKLTTLINILGLAIGIAFCILVLLFVEDELSYDKFHTKGDLIYRVAITSEDAGGKVLASAYVPMPLLPAMCEDFPEVALGARCTGNRVVVQSGTNCFTEVASYTDPDFFRIFDVTFVSGNKDLALQDPAGVVITREMAAKYFGAEEALGRRLTIRTPASSDEFVVAGVVESMPHNSSIQFDFLLNIQKRFMYDRLKDRWTSSNGSAFVLIRKGVQVEDLLKKLPLFVEKHLAPVYQKLQAEGLLAKVDPMVMTLQPISAMHLGTDVVSSPEGSGNPEYSYILAAVGILVLTIACINFVTLTVGRSANRAREVGIRKVLGAARVQVMRQFWGEALLLCSVAVAVGVVLAEILLPTFNELSGKKLALDALFQGWLIPGLVTLFVVVGLMAGSYPALVLSRFQPAQVLKGNVRVGGRGWFPKALVVVQFALAIFLICGALVMTSQLRFLLTTDLGFRAEQVVVLPMHIGDHAAAAKFFERFRARIQENPSIVRVSATSGAFTHGYDINGFQYDGRQRSTYVYRVDEEFLGTLGISVKDGRNFTKGSADDRDRAMVVNRAFLREMDWPEPALGRHLTGTDSKSFEKYSIIGVVDDFHFLSLREEIRPMLMLMDEEWPLGDILVRIAPANMPATVEYLRGVWSEMAQGTPFDLTFLDEDFSRLYETEERWGRIITLSSVLAVSLACLGLFGLATLAVTNRTKEIGIRRVLGSTGAGVVRVISADFLKLVILANLIAWPAAYIAASAFLENYAYRIPLGPWIFLGAGFAALVLAFVTIVGQILRAVRANPVESLRYE